MLLSLDQRVEAKKCLFLRSRVRANRFKNTNPGKLNGIESIAILVVLHRGTNGEELAILSRLMSTESVLWVVIPNA